jgi:hypothetical protein
MRASLSRTVQFVRNTTAPVGDVWALLTDIPAAAVTLSGVDRIEILSGKEYAVGYQWRETRTRWGKSVTEEMRVVAATAPRWTVVEANSDGVQYRFEFTLERNPLGGTQIRSMFSGTLVDHPTTRRWISWRMFGGMGVRLAAGVMRQDLADITTAADDRARSTAN